MTTTAAPARDERATEYEEIRRLATEAHAGTSFSPERRGEAWARDYFAHLDDVRAWIEEIAPADMVDELFAEYAAGYKQRWRALMHAKARCLSPMIVGPSRFPAHRMAKRNETERRRSAELTEYEARARRRIERRIAEATRPADPVAEIRAEIEKHERMLEAMKQCNAILRRKKLTEDEKVAAIVEATGFSEDAARKLATVPDFAGRLGFPAYELTSTRGKIERLRAKLATFESAPAEPERFAGAKIEEDIHDDRLRIHFDEVPPEAIREQLKRAGFRWSRRHGAWQRQLTAQARIDARRILGAS